MSNIKRLKNIEWGKDISPAIMFSNWKQELVSNLANVVNENRMRPEFEIEDFKID